jgi:AmmeMemoRadiSam system protein A
LASENHPLVSLAIQSVKHQLEKGFPLPCPSPLPKGMQQQAGTFVTIKKNRLLRGCIGTIQPKYANVAEEVIQNAIKAMSEDPRFPAVEIQELKELTFSVDILTIPEKIKDTASLDVKRYGLIVQNENKKGLLLPNLENIKTIDQQLKACLNKGGMKETDNYELYRFKVKRLY